MRHQPRAVTTTIYATDAVPVIIRVVMTIFCFASMLSLVVAQAPAFDPLAPGNARPPVRPIPATRQTAPVATAPAAAKPAPAQPAASSKPKSKIPDEMKPRLEKIVAKDGLPLYMGYLPSDKGKKAVPVLLIHEWAGDMRPYFTLAEKLQASGCAVAMLDIRGHGRSVILDADGKPEKVERATKTDMQMVAKFDMEAAKKFLRAENDAEKLNLNALVVIGVAEGAILAMNWSVMDWSWPTFKKQGQDVKAMILISPVKSVNGIAGEAPRHAIVSKLPVMIVSGAGISENSEANRLAKLFEKARVTNKFSTAQPYPVDALRVQAQLSGPMLVYKGPGVIDGIAKFVTQNVVDNVSNFEWVVRSDD